MAMGTNLVDKMIKKRRRLHAELKECETRFYTGVDKYVLPTHTTPHFPAHIPFILHMHARKYLYDLTYTHTTAKLSLTDIDPGL